MFHRVFKPFRLSGLVFVLILSACTSHAETLSPVNTTGNVALNRGSMTQPATSTPFQPSSSEPQSSPTPQPSLSSEGNLMVWVDSAVPGVLRNVLSGKAGVAMAASPQGANLQLLPQTKDDQGSEALQVIQWVYALTAPFNTVTDGITSSDLRAAWQGQPPGPFGDSPILMDSSTLAVFRALWGQPAEGAVAVLPADQLLDYAWQHAPAWAILPFEELGPRWKVLTVDGQSPLHRDFDAGKYALAARFVLKGAPEVAARLQNALGLASDAAILPATNRDPGKLTVLVMTGVTALVRATAAKMEQRGIDYPAQDIGAWLRDADLTHISNEVPFDPNCPKPDPLQATLQFCSDPAYIKLLQDVGTDIVELTGNHLEDYGPDAALYTLNLYKQEGWKTYGGGANLAQSRQPALVEHNGNRLAFMGCNPVGPASDWATDSQPGSTPCDYALMESQIADLRASGYLPIVTFQYNEYYQFAPSETQVRDFHAMAKAGAVIVSGSQAHFPQAMGFLGDSFIHYGLGNLFFDQMDYPVVGTRREFIDRHVFYDGRYIGTELLTAMLEDYARPRPMTPAERQSLLQDVFAVSDWAR
jgi:hypothetical protein